MASVKQNLECMREWLAVREQKTKSTQPKFSKTDLYKHQYKTKGII